MPAQCQADHPGKVPICGRQSQVEGCTQACAGCIQVDHFIHFGSRYKVYVMSSRLPWQPARRPSAVASRKSRAALNFADGAFKSIISRILAQGAKSDHDVCNAPGTFSGHPIGDRPRRARGRPDGKLASGNRPRPIPKPILIEQAARQSHVCLFQ